MRRVLITGASRGIGKEIADSLVKNGDIVVSINRNMPSLYKEGYSGNRLIIGDDLSKRNSGRRIIRKMEKEGLLPVDAIIYCAGVAPLSTIENNENSLIENTFQVNVLSFVDIMEELIKGEGINENGSVITISSVAVHKASNRQSVYAGSKACLEFFTSYYSKELLSSNIKCNSIVCGAVNTDMLQTLKKENPLFEIAMKENYPLGIIDKKEIAEITISLVNKELDLKSGESLIVDSGFLL